MSRTYVWQISILDSKSKRLLRHLDEVSQLHINTVDGWNPAQVDSMTHIVRYASCCDVRHAWWCSHATFIFTCATLHDQVPHPTQNFLLWWRISHQFLNLLSRTALWKTQLESYCLHVADSEIFGILPLVRLLPGGTKQPLASPEIGCQEVHTSPRQDAEMVEHLWAPDSLAFQQLPSTLTGVLEPSWARTNHFGRVMGHARHVNWP